MSLLITTEELEDRLTSAEIVYHRLGHGSDDSPRPRSEQFKSGIPKFVREIIAGEVRAGNGSQKDIAESWGISSTAARYAGEGRIGAHQLKGEDTDLERKAEEIANDITNRTVRLTSEKLLNAIDSIKDDTVQGEKPIVQTVIARNLATVLEKLSPKIVAQTNVQFNVYTPTTKRLEEFGEPIRIVEVETKR